MLRETAADSCLAAVPSERAYARIKPVGVPRVFALANDPFDHRYDIGKNPGFMRAGERGSRIARKDRSSNVPA